MNIYGVGVMDKVTIITVCYNAEKHIRDTMISVLEQEYCNIEYLVIDGKSKDNTVYIAQQCRELYPHMNCCIISEKDNGIYDAMNKGIDLATGEWILFMNAGDKFHSSKVVSLFFSKKYDERVSAVYGNTVRIHNGKRIFVEGKPLWEIRKGFPLPFCHQSIFVRCCYLKEKGFDTAYKQAADYKFFCEMYLQKVYFEHIDVIVSDYLMGGISETNTVFHLNEKIHIREELGIQKYSKVQKKFLLMHLSMKQTIKKILPKKIVEYIVEIRSKK